MDLEQWLEQNPWPIILCATLPFALVGVYLICIALKGGRLVRASQRWPATVGRVIQSDVEVVRRRKSVSRASTWSVAYYPQIVYEYQVNGQVYQGTALTLTHRVGYGSPGEAQHKAAEYPVGATVQVYYNPQNPEQAALHQHAPFNWLIALVGVGLIVAMALIWATVGNPAFTK